MYARVSRGDTMYVRLSRGDTMHARLSRDSGEVVRRVAQGVIKEGGNHQRVTNFYSQRSW